MYKQSTEKMKNRKDRNIIQYSVKDRKEIGRRVENRKDEGETIWVLKRGKGEGGRGDLW